MNKRITSVLDKTETRKVGKTTYTVSSFLRADSPMTFLEVLKRLIRKDLDL